MELLLQQTGYSNKSNYKTQNQFSLNLSQLPFVSTLIESKFYIAVDFLLH